ncbi:MAG: DUF4010 domain-containing protein [Bacteroidales bacterium]|nr:DUF4010 domain-containing protein [Candidatus Scybalocola fimicaballi]
MESIKDIFSTDIINFAVVALMSLVIGLSQRKLYEKNSDIENTFGSDRTFTLIGILGYVLYVIGGGSLTPFLCGGATLSLLLAIMYAHKLFIRQRTGITSIVIALITYCIAPIMFKTSMIIAILVVVSVLVLAEMKDKFIEFTKKMNDEEFINLAKFLIIAGVVLPILPNNELVAGSGLTPYTIWLATVVISGISYISYLVKKYIFPDGGVIITGILGGIYSSTATCIILAKKAKDHTGDLKQYVAAIFCAISMMYFKIFILLGIFNAELTMRYWYMFVIMIIVSGIVAFFFYRQKPKAGANGEKEKIEDEEEKNPLEFKVAILFAVLFIAFTLVTNYALIYFGDSGLRILSIIVGVTDINPFIINLFQNQNVTGELIVLAAFQAIISNNVVKMFYGMFFSGNKLMKDLCTGFGVICAINILLLIVAL